MKRKPNLASGAVDGMQQVCDVPNSMADAGAVDALPNRWSTDARRRFDRIQLGSGGIEIETMIYRRSEAPRRPLLIVNSIEFPMAPSIEFCELMWKNGLQVVFIRRLGFGAMPELPSVLLTEENIRSGAAAATEAALLHQFIKQLNLKNVVLLGIGSGNPVCYRLSKLNQNIDISIFSNPVFNQDSWIGFRPAWFRAMLRQTVMTKNGFKVAAQGLRFYLRRNADTFHEQIFQKSKGDRAYIAENFSDTHDAIELMKQISSETFFYDLTMSMRPDPSLRDGYFEGHRAIVLSGLETTDEWLSETRREASRLAIPVQHAERGGMLVAYASPDTLLSIIKEYSQ